MARLYRGISIKKNQVLELESLNYSVVNNLSGSIDNDPINLQQTTIATFDLPDTSNTIKGYVLEFNATVKASRTDVNEKSYSIIKYRVVIGSYGSSINTNAQGSISSIGRPITGGYVGTYGTGVVTVTLISGNSYSIKLVDPYVEGSDGVTQGLTSDVKLSFTQIDDGFVVVAD